MKHLLIMAFFLAFGTLGMSQNITAHVPGEIKGGGNLVLSLTTAEQVTASSTSNNDARRAGLANNSTHWLITKDVDSKSPAIESAANKGRIWKRVILKIETDDGGIKYDLINCYLSSYSVSAGGNGSTETFKIHYQNSSSSVSN